MSPRTVGTHVHAIHAKLGVSSTHQACLAALRLGLLGEHPKIIDIQRGKTLLVWESPEEMAKALS